MRYITYNEFFDKIINELGYGISTAQCSNGEGTIYITKKDSDDALISIDKNSQYTFDLEIQFFWLDEIERNKLYRVATAFAGTPKDERFPEKRYRYRLPMISEKHYQYINLEIDTNTLMVSTSTSGLIFKTIFTESEIKALTPEQQKLFEIAEKEEVE